MEIFLKLPEELWILIIKYINDESKIEELCLIPALQKYAIQARYSEFVIDGPIARSSPICRSDGSIKNLLKLYEVYNFKPSRIILEATKLSELLKVRIAESQDTRNFEVETVSLYGHAEFEIKITEGMYVDLKSIFKKVNVIGVYISGSYPINLLDNEVMELQTYLEAIQTSKIEFMNLIYSKGFAVKFPTSLKKLKLHMIPDKIEINLSELQSLEYFECCNLKGVKSIDALHLSKTIRSIKLAGCQFETLGNLKNYDNLRSFGIEARINLFEMFKLTFPDSLERLILGSYFTHYDVIALSNDVIGGTNNHFEISDFSDDMKYLQIGSKFKLPPNLKVLGIYGIPKSLEFKYIPSLGALNSLELCGIKIRLNEVFISLPRIMMKLEINRCEVNDVERDLKYPKVRQFNFLYNQVSNIFQIDLKEMVDLDRLEICENTLVVPGSEEIKLDPFQFLIGEYDLLDETNESLNKKRKVSKTFKTLQIDLSGITYMSLSRSEFNNSEGTVINTSNGIIQLPSQICIKGCTILKTLHLFDLGIKILDLHRFPPSLSDLRMTNLELFQIKGEFSLLSQLTKLWLVKIGITYSMLVLQRFPSTLKDLDLSKNKIEDLTCLKIDNCDKLHHLVLKEVTGSINPKGADELKKMLVALARDASQSFGEVTTYDSEVVFRVINGNDKD
ncbi:uncharacterized protein KGF55_000023 [Candida pseudojiufengensis]|uniref:uncharacterized protein n=1 Tax=Candida pseudojiufengensis TaxID=497109 RepID=UPI002225165C|nr:uncharacterized protein KGF55_000023 [Candida pseudojiufengensis]KAI5968118.1 hypothetical protein KGF55_000023 [Candida pseudojiufengensis]